MSEACPDCDFSKVMSDGTLFCALLEAQVHGDQTCGYWTNNPSLFIHIDMEGIGFDEEDD